MRVRTMLLFFYLALSASGIAQQSVDRAAKQPYSLSVTPKLHSAGHSPYSGTYFNHDLNLEVNITYKYRHVSAFITKYIDFVDTHSSVNFTTAGIFRSIQVNERLKVTPYVGYFFGQARSWMDKSSDMWTGLAIKWDLSEWLWVENTTLVGNLLHHNATTSLANRLNAGIMIGQFKLDAYTWYSHSMHTPFHFVSAGLGITSPEWILSSSVSMKVQITVLQQIADEKPNGTITRGGFISLIVPVEWTNE